MIDNRAVNFISTYINEIEEDERQTQLMTNNVPVLAISILCNGEDGRENGGSGHSNVIKCQIGAKIFWESA